MTLGTRTHVGDDTDIQELVDDWLKTPENLKHMDRDECFATGVHAGVDMACKKLDERIMLFCAKQTEDSPMKDISTIETAARQLGRMEAIRDMYRYLVEGTQR